jgi:hypothetical protein
MKTKKRLAVIRAERLVFTPSDVFITNSAFQYFVQQLSKILDAAMAIVKSVRGKNIAEIITKTPRDARERLF